MPHMAKRPIHALSIASRRLAVADARHEVSHPRHFRNHAISISHDDEAHFMRGGRIFLAHRFWHAAVSILSRPRHALTASSAVLHGSARGYRGHAGSFMHRISRVDISMH